MGSDMNPKEADFSLPPDPLLSGSTADVARQRVAFYRELLEIEGKVLAEMQELVARRPEEVRQAVIDSNIEPLEDLISDVERRLAFWEQQLADRERRGT